MNLFGICGLQVNDPYLSGTSDYTALVQELDPTTCGLASYALLTSPIFFETYSKQISQIVLLS